MTTSATHQLPLGQMLRQLRQRRGLSQKDLAAILRGLAGREGLQRDEVSRWERVARVPKPRWLAWLAVALDAPLAELDAARRAQLGGEQGDDPKHWRRVGGPAPARLLGAAAQVGTRFRDRAGRAVPNVEEVDDLREAVRQTWLHGEPDETALSPAGVSRSGEPTAGRGLADALGWHQVPQLSAEQGQRADEELADAQERVCRFYGIGVPDAGPAEHGQRPGPTGAEPPPSRTEVDPRMRPRAQVRVAGRDLAALVAFLVANRDDVRWRLMPRIASESRTSNEGLASLNTTPLAWSGRQ